MEKFNAQSRRDTPPKPPVSRCWTLPASRVDVDVSRCVVVPVSRPALASRELPVEPSLLGPASERPVELPPAPSLPPVAGCEEPPEPLLPPLLVVPPFPLLPPVPTRAEPPLPLLPPLPVTPPEPSACVLVAPPVVGPWGSRGFPPVGEHPTIARDTNSVPAAQLASTCLAFIRDLPAWRPISTEERSMNSSRPTAAPSVRAGGLCLARSAGNCINGTQSL